MRSIAALMLREMGARYGRTPGGYVWALLEPLGMIIILSFAWSLLARSPSLGTSYLLFKGTGLLTLHMFTTLGNQVGRAMLFSKALLFYPRVTWMDAIIARFALNLLVTMAVMTIILTGIMIYEDIRTVLDWGRIAQAVVLTALVGLGVGCLNCYLFQRFPVWQTIWAILTRPLFIISGIIIIYEDFPPIAQAVLWYNPILHLTGIMRDGFYPIYTPQYISLIYIGLWIVIPMVVGLLLLRQFHRDLLNR
ncbi:ABC transporter permease [Rhodobacteraceae bacterium 2376]|uniref:ABC transporter permease n=1 Tax=Rhabdonatronobacter sediminivivens TaxID=2743469 RepID=A0A7Z0KZ83_9RHOB|nr:ABC transporter permease [Rhabdonatronobacter sediminivivens]NYS26437.1 ABC transporter permease [Rhabdonatronobacter sediminivivens]